MTRGDSGLSDSQFMRCQKSYQRKHKAIKRLYRLIDKTKTEKQTIFQKITIWVKSLFGY